MNFVCRLHCVSWSWEGLPGWWRRQYVSGHIPCSETIGSSATMSATVTNRSNSNSNSHRHICSSGSSGTIGSFAAAEYCWHGRRCTVAVDGFHSHSSLQQVIQAV